MIDYTVTVGTGPFIALWRLIMPPMIEFGSPVQRLKDESVSHWHIPIKISRKLKVGAGSMSRCKVYLDRYDGDRFNDSIRMCWGDAHFTNLSEMIDLVVGEPFLVPIVRRSENDNTRCAFITDTRFHKSTELDAYPLSPDREKHRFKLRVEAGGAKPVISDHLYIIRVPEGASNGHFVVEIEFDRRK